MVLTVLTAVLTAAPGAYLEACPQPMTTAPARSGRRWLAPGGGTVAVESGRLVLTTCAFENHRVLPLTVEVKTPAETLAVAGRVSRGAPLSVGGTMTVNGLAPAEFLRAHPFLFDPWAEPVLLVVDVEDHVAARFERGVKTHTWEVGRGQAEGEKTVRGDLKTPRGLYFVTDKSTGPFAGDFAAYYGGHWVKANYPNAFDAQRGLKDSLISGEVASGIARDWWRRQLTVQRTKLGGGIGFHGWIAPWRGDVEGFGLSWGCVVAHPEDVAELYASLPVGAAVVLR